MKPHRKSQKKLTEILNMMYGHLDSKYLAAEAEVIFVHVVTYSVQNSSGSQIAISP